MRIIREVKLEIVRPGPLHNQLLSPLTSYIALCGEGSPVTVTVPMEHRQLLNRLERMRYVTPDPKSGQPIRVPERFRESELVELGEVIADILSQVPTLISELTSGDRNILVHLRLVLMGSELALIPFELAISPQAFPGEGVEFSLQSSVPVVITREVRRSRSEQVAWDARADARILFAYSAPDGLRVPARQHAQLLREAVEPWVRWPEDLVPGDSEQDNREFEEQRLEIVREHFRILPNASIDGIRELCARHDFTHVHILAHGDSYEDAGQRSFGIALNKAHKPDRKHVVTGRQLAEAVQAENELGQRRSQPLVVSLATCDSGNAGSVMIPGGSIAHELHVAGIPWVFASQFPLTVAGSIRLMRTLYRRLLRGDDPRAILFEVRRELHIASEKNHDWTSLVAYGAPNPLMTERIANFFEARTKLAINIGLDRVDSLLRSRKGNKTSKDNKDAMTKTLRRVRDDLDMWEERLPQGDTPDERSRRTECYGIQGSTRKRLALIEGSDEDSGIDSKKELRESRDCYDRAIHESAYHEYRFHWVATQFLSLSAILQDDKDPELLQLARCLAGRASKENPKAEERAWAFATLAELEVVGLYHDSTDDVVSKACVEKAADKARKYCECMVGLVDRKSFHVQSTVRQFERYREKFKLQTDIEWSMVIDAALDVLEPGSSATPSEPASE